MESVPMTKKGFVPREDQPVVEIVQQSYQPSKADLEADVRLKGTFKQAIQALIRPVRIRRVRPRPRSRILPR